jgi:hypothetical protein
MKHGFQTRKKNKLFPIQWYLQSSLQSIPDSQIICGDIPLDRRSSEHLLFFGAPFPAGKQICPFFLFEKWTSRGLFRDLAAMSTVPVVIARTPPNDDHVRRSLRGPLLMPPKTPLHGPCKVHFFGFSQIEYIG